MNESLIEVQRSSKIAGCALAISLLLSSCGTIFANSKPESKEMPQPASKPLEDYVFDADPTAGSVRELMALVPEATEVQVENFNEPGEEFWNVHLIYSLPSGKTCRALTDRPADPTTTPDDMITLLRCYNP